MVSDASLGASGSRPFVGSSRTSSQAPVARPPAIEALLDAVGDDLAAIDDALGDRKVVSEDLNLVVVAAGQFDDCTTAKT